MIRAVMWDNDGTLVNSEQVYADVSAKVYERYGHKVDNGLYEKHIGLPMDDIIRLINEELMLEIPPSQIREEIKNEYKLLGAVHVPLTEHALEVLEKLHGTYTMGIVSNAKSFWIDEVMKAHDLHKFFAVVVTRDTVGRYKPYPDPYLKAVEVCGLTPAETVAIEDSPTGMAAAKDAGLMLIGYKSHHNRSTDFSLADYVVEDLREVPKILEKINKS